ncbi:MULTISPECIES: hypothetical protein [Glutamicibacter]|uniref:hypothetical protein n=1 Tax=Glutamicibacter TaxID=1742989 RepID=UPI003FD4AD65
MPLFQTVLPESFTESADPALFTWPVILLMFGATVALYLAPLLIGWFIDSVFSNPSAGWASKSISGLLSAISVFFAVVLPIRLIEGVEYPSDAWRLAFGFSLIGLVFIWWMHKITENSRVSWIIGGSYTGLVLLTAFFVSMSILLSNLGAYLATIPVGLIVVTALLIFSRR